MRKLLLLSPVLLLLLLSARKENTNALTAKSIEQQLCLIPAQELDTLTYPAFYDQPPTAPKVKIDSFYLSCYEVTNGMYVEYLFDLQRHDTAAYRKALPDTMVWREKLAYNEPYVDYYLRHPAYRDYPVVGVTQEQALAYCDWLTKRYNAFPKKKFSNVRFDLPTKNEWWAAANGGMQYPLFSWGGPYLHNSKGMRLANYRYINEASIRRDTINGKIVYVSSNGGDDIGIAGMLNDAADITAPVYSYWPNAYGLYNMNGNVEELVKEPGVTKGGSWRDPGYYLMNRVEERYDPQHSASPERGFRVCMRIR